MRRIWVESVGFCNAPITGQSTLDMFEPESLRTCISNITLGPSRDTFPVSEISSLPWYSL